MSASSPGRQASSLFLLPTRLATNGAVRFRITLPIPHRSALHVRWRHHAQIERIIAKAAAVDPVTQEPAGTCSGSLAAMSRGTER